MITLTRILKEKPLSCSKNAQRISKICVLTALLESIFACLCAYASTTFLAFRFDPEVYLRRVELERVFHKYSGLLGTVMAKERTGSTQVAVRAGGG